MCTTIQISQVLRPLKDTPASRATAALRPIVASRPEDSFYLIKPSRDNFHVDVAHAIEGALNVPASETGWVTPLILGVLCVFVLGVIFFAGGEERGSGAQVKA
jgi:hypothetical protein